MNIEDKKIPPEWRLHFLAWIDAMEKLDIMVLELRHLQQTCVYGLRLPELLGILQREEVLLDPRTNKSEWQNLKANVKYFEPDNDTLEQARRIARDHILLYPDITPEVAPDSTNKKESTKEEELIDKIRGRVRESWLLSSWSDSRKDLYDVLAGAQRLKRQIFSDHLFLFLEGRNALFKRGHSRKPNVSETGPHLFILRIGVLSRAHTYLERIGDLQQRLAQHIEAMPMESPYPSVQRRRVQGIYTHYLIDRVKYIRETLNLLLGYLRDEKPEKQPPIFHRWLHAYSSSQGTFPNEINDDTSSRENSEEVDFVRTGYWMPDKPDNQPILAHELAHHAIRQHYDNLLPQSLSNVTSKDRFAALMREIIAVLTHPRYQVPVYIRKSAASKDLIEPVEIACDLLAGSAKGISYLYAFFMEAVGWGLEHTLVDQHLYFPHLNVRLELRHSPDAAFARDLRDWYVRGRVLVTWLRATKNVNQDVDRWVLDGFDNVLHDLNRYLDGMISNPELKSGEYWENVADSLCQVVKTSSAARLTTKWRNSRRNDAKIDRRKVRRFPRFAAPLPKSLRDGFVSILEDSKGNGLSSTLSVSENDKDALFKHVFDIPWQCAILKASEFYDDDEKCVYTYASKLYIDINTRTSLGRDFFFLAVEVDYAVDQPPCERLRTLLRLIKSKNKLEDMPSKLKKWVEDTNNSLNDELCARESGQPTYEIRKRQYQQGELLEKFITTFKDENKAWWEKNVGGQHDSLIIPYLSIHSPRKQSVNYGDQLANIFFNTVNKEADNQKLEFALLSRIVVAKKQSIFDNTDDNNDGNTGSLQSSGFDNEDQKTSDSGNEDQNGSGLASEPRSALKDKEHQLNVLGEYHALVIRQDYSPLCRCPTPRLKDHRGKECSEPLFSRRETLLRTRVTENDMPLPDLSNERFKSAVAVLFIQLNRRFTRLDFLCWIRDEGKKPEQLGLCDTDDVYLTDGWADIVFILGPLKESDPLKIKEKRTLSDIFELQQRVHDNFMVSQTELLPTDTCLNCIDEAGDLKKKNDYIIYSLVRLDESRFAEPMYKSFIQELQRVLKKQEFERQPVIFHTPGRMETVVQLEQANYENYNKLKLCLDSDRLQRYIDSYNIFLIQKEKQEAFN